MRVFDVPVKAVAVRKPIAVLQFAKVLFNNKEWKEGLDDEQVQRVYHAPMRAIEPAGSNIGKCEATRLQLLEHPQFVSQGQETRGKRDQDTS